MSKCEKCKHCVITIGGYDGSSFLECKLQREQARKATQAELLEFIKHPEKRICTFERGKPVDGGVSYDD